MGHRRSQMTSQRVKEQKSRTREGHETTSSGWWRDQWCSHARACAGADVPQQLRFVTSQLGV